MSLCSALPHVAPKPNIRPGSLWRFGPPRSAPLLMATKHNAVLAGAEQADALRRGGYQFWLHVRGEPGGGATGLTP